MADAMKLVPVEPTEAMLDEACYFWGPWLDAERTQRAGRRSDDPGDRERAKAVWQQMLAASPPAPAREAVAWPCGPNPIGDPMEAVQHPNGRWCVEQVVDDGAICMTWFDGPYAGWRARNYARTRPAPATADKLRVIAEGLSGAMSWVDYPFVENNTSEEEIRQRLGFMMKDAEPHRQALAALTEEG